MNLRCLFGHHHWRLSSHTITQLHDAEDDDVYGYQVSAVLECDTCRKRRYVQHGSGKEVWEMHRTEAECMVWLRSKCSAVPSRMPESFGEVEAKP